LVVDVPDVALRLMQRFWPGALTIVMRRNPSVTMDLGSNTSTIGVRAPDHAVPLALCRAVGPLATTSANRHGEATLPTPSAIATEFGEHVAVVVDAGSCTGSPSTVVDCTGDEVRVLRAGRIPWEEITAVL
jgi:tRNA threonylcarbamoyl adenosine modification protein (Sua5/YciO/YrdC/YwlC family)